METKDFSIEIIFDVNPHEVYEALMDDKKHSAFSGEPCEISRDIGGKFTCYSGYIEGENVDLDVDKLIVQKWRGKDWPEGLFSTIIYELEENDGGTLLKFSQEGIPADKVDHIKEGWKQHYWDKLKIYFGE